MARPCWYTLVLRHGTEKFYLAPRASISVDEGNDLESLGDQGCASCGQTVNRTWKFKANFVSCDLLGSWALFNKLQTFLNEGCAEGDLTIERTVCAETPLVYQIRKSHLRMTDSNLQFGTSSPRVLAIEIELELSAWVEAGEGAVLVGA